MFVFAVTVLIYQYLRSCVGLVPALTQRETYVTEVLGDKLIECLNLVRVARATAQQFVGLCFYLIVRADPVTLERRIPLTYFSPTLKGRNLNLRRFRFLVFFALLVLTVVLIIFVIALEVRVFPEVQTSGILILDRWIQTLFILEFDNAVTWNVDLELLVEDDEIFPHEVVLKPKMIRSKRRVYVPGYVIFEDVSGTKPWHCDVFLPNVRIDRSLARNWRGQVLNIAR